MNVDLGRGRTKRELTRAGRIPVLVDHTQSPPFCVMETSAELLYLLKFADKKDMFGFTDELERNEALQWLFFWHGSGAPYVFLISRMSKPVLTIVNLKIPGPDEPLWQICQGEDPM
jgi:glutathione S-transferase